MQINVEREGHALSCVLNKNVSFHSDWTTSTHLNRCGKQQQRIERFLRGSNIITYSSISICVPIQIYALIHPVSLSFVRPISENLFVLVERTLSSCPYKCSSFCLVWGVRLKGFEVHSFIFRENYLCSATKRSLFGAEESCYDETASSFEKTNNVVWHVWNVSIIVGCYEASSV